MMVIFLISVILTVCTANIIPTESIHGEERQYPRFMNMYDDTGKPHLVDLKADIDEATRQNISRSAEFNEYWLYTRSNPTVPQYLYFGQAESVINSNFNIGRPVVVSVHGWINSGHTEPNPALIPVLLANDDYNIIVLDWSRMANTAYTVAVAAVPAVGQGLGQFLAFLNSLGVPWSSMHLIGFSLGGHLVGSAGREVGGRVARITSLDPAGPLWTSNTNRIASTDAVYVEGIHTDSGTQGIGMPIGDVDFFPNGVTGQTGCPDSSCNHHRAWELMAATITYNHLWGNLCGTMTNVIGNTCTGPLFPLGNDDLRKSGSGIFRVNTGAAYPY